MTYTWSKDDNQSIPNSKVINQKRSLKIDTVRVENQGKYTCFVENIEGNASTEAYITVFGKYTRRVVAYIIVGPVSFHVLHLLITFNCYR